MVSVTGELQAEKSQEITGPIEIRNNRELRFNDIRIQDLVAEGTIVKVGDFVAKLDGSQAANTLRTFAMKPTRQPQNIRIPNSIPA